MENPTRQRQLEELDQVELCTRILYQARNELYVNMHFLDVSLSSLGFEADWNRNGMACDGAVIYYGPGFLLGLYKKGRAVVNRYYLHTLFHCLFCHLYTRKGREKKMWDLACDIVMESVLDGMYEKCIHVPQSPLRREMYLRLRRFLTAERVYHALMEMELPKRRMEQLEAEFHVDDHDLWEQEPDPSAAMTRQNQWNDNRERMQTQMETMGAEEESENEQSLLDSIQVENEERYDYRQFLKKFAVLREEMQTDPDSFDQAFYTYGLSLYGNMPLIEPLETREVQRIQQFVIVIDTSMSCSGELVQRFLEETYDVLSQSETYFRKVQIHVIQCDDKVQSDVILTCADDLKAYMEHFQIKGYGGTDFRPAFEYVNTLKVTGQLNGLKGLIYFTDGKGIYPVAAPTYDVAFVFIKERFSEEDFPAWAMRVVLDEETFNERRQ